MARVAFFMVPFVYEGGVGRGRGSDLLLNAVLFVPKWSGLSSPFLSSFGKLGVDFILFRGDCIYRNVPKYRNELEIPKRTIKYIGKCRFGSCLYR